MARSSKQPARSQLNVASLPCAAECDNPCHDDTIISLKNVCVAYDKKSRALSNLSLPIERGEHVAVMGPSGSGKTTLLRCIACRISPLFGEVVCRGKVATIYQDLNLVTQKSALSNVLDGSMGRHSFIRTFLRFPTREKRRARELLEKVGLEHKEETLVKRLSGGEKQRVAIARALMQDPDIILADEPVASLDEVNAHAIMQRITTLAKERNITVISVLHDRHLAKLYADRIIELNDGEITRDIPSVHSWQPGDKEKKCPPTKNGAPQKSNNRQHKRFSSLSAKDSFAKPLLLLSGLLLFLWACLGLDITSRHFEGLFPGLAGFISQLVPTSWQEFQQIPWATLSQALVETLQMALVGTVFGVAISWPLSALAAKTTGPRLIREPVRFMLNAIRTVPSLIWALLFVAAVGLGTLAGIFALVAYSVGYLSKFFYEHFEAVEPGAPSALKDMGASGLQQFVHAVWPAAKPAVLSSSLFMLEYNVRAASVLGVVDAGGIGFYIKEYIDFRFFPAVTASLAMILIVVLILDAVSSRVRAKLMESV